jgi:methionyl-tRNA formyltransferase
MRNALPGSVEKTGEAGTRERPMRNVLVGAVEGTEVALRAMAAAGHPPVLVVTLPPEKAARHSDYRDLHPVARELGIETLDAAQVNDPAVIARLEQVGMDHLFVLGWSQLIGPAVMRTARKGAIGLHPAPLPELRGRAVIPWTILTRRTRTATSLFWIDEGTDSGDLLAQRMVEVAPDETARSLYDKHTRTLGAMLEAVLPALAEGNAPREPQDHARASWCAKRTPADGLIDWTRPAEEVWTLVRAVGRPYPGAFTYRGDGTKLFVWSADLVPEAPYLGIPGQVVAFDENKPFTPSPSTPPLRGYAQDERKHPFTPSVGPAEPARSRGALRGYAQDRRSRGALVACGEGFVRLRTVSLEGGDDAEPRAVLKLHERLGIPLDALFAALRERR